MYGRVEGFEMEEKGCLGGKDPCGCKKMCIKENVVLLEEQSFRWRKVRCGWREGGGKIYTLPLRKEREKKGVNGS